MNANADKLIELFGQAQRKSPAERARFLAEACQGEPEVREQIESLLRAQEEAGEFLKSTVVLANLEQPGDKIGHYKLLQQIGEGGCGVVYMAEQEEPVRRRVALKVIKLGMDTKSVIARFEAERQALALMDHPNIAKVLDAGATDTGRPYFVMELVRGIKITEYCDQNNLTTRQRLDLFIKVCQAIQHAHQKGIIHRDIKPSNILVTLHDGVPVPKVIDFGIAKATTDQRLTDKTIFTAFEQFIGTPAYMSPEQAEMSGLDIDTRADIYALGVLFYELLTGQTPFDGKELLAAGLDGMRRIIREKEPARPSTRLGTMLEGDLTTTARHRQTEAAKLIHLLRGDLDWIVMKALEKDRTRRYETANGLAMDIQRYLRNEPILARPPSAVYRVRKFVRRNKGTVAAVSVVLAVLVLGVLVSTWEAVVATAAKRDAMRAQQHESAQRQQAVAARDEAQRNDYFSKMNLAQADWEQNNLARFWQSLEETRAYPGRGFEWYYWQREMHRDLMTLRGHTGRVGSLAISPDGKWIASGSDDQTAKVWEFSTGHLLSTCTGHLARVRHVTFFPDGKRLISCSDDKTVRLWDPNTGQELQRLSASDAVRSVVVSKEPVRIVAGCENGDAVVWDAQGKSLRTLDAPTHGEWVGIWGLAVSSNGQTVVAGTDEGQIWKWDLGPGEAPPQRLSEKEQGNRVWSIALSPDEKWIVCGRNFGDIQLWDAATGTLKHTLRGHHGSVMSTAFSPDGQRIVTGGEDETTRVWSLETRQELQILKGHQGAVWAAAFTPDGHKLVTCGGEEDHTLKIWDAETSSGSLHLKHGAPAVNAAMVLKESITNAGAAALEVGAGVWSIAFSPDSQWLLTAGDGGSARIWNAENGSLQRTLTGHHKAAVTSAAFSPDGRRVLTGSIDGSALIWELLDQERPPLALLGHTGPINTVACSPDGRLAATASDDKTVKLWDCSIGQLQRTLSVDSNAVEALAFGPGGDWLVGGGQDPIPRLWTLPGGQVRKFGQLPDGFGNPLFNRIFAMAVSSDGRRIAAGHWLLAEATIWDASTGRYLFSLKGHTYMIWSLAFSPNGQQLISGSWDGKVKLWDIQTQHELLSFKVHDGDGREVRAVAWSPDGRRIACGSTDGTAKIWTAATPAEVASWQQAEAEAERRLEAMRRAQRTEEKQ